MIWLTSIMCFVILVIYVKVLTTIQYKLWKEKLFKRCPHYQTRIFVNEKKGKHIIGPVELFELHYYHGSFTHKRCQATKQTQFFFRSSHTCVNLPHIFFTPKPAPSFFRCQLHICILHVFFVIVSACITTRGHFRAGDL